MTYLPGGGGGRVRESDESDEYALSKPFDLSGGFNADTLSQINQMFEELYLANIRTRANLVQLQGSAAPILTVTRRPSVAQVQNAFNAGSGIVLVPGVPGAIIVPVFTWMALNVPVAFSLNPTWTLRWGTGPGAGTAATTSVFAAAINVAGFYFSNGPIAPSTSNVGISGATLVAVIGAPLLLQHTASAAMTGGDGTSTLVVCDYQVLPI